MRCLLEAILLLCLALPAMADEAPDIRVKIRPDIPWVDVPTPNGTVRIMRVQDTDARLEGEWARIARPCPPFCIQPMDLGNGATTIGELELLEMLQDPEAIVVDSRTREWFETGTIPGAVHIPYTEMGERLEELGCEPDFDGWDCSAARRVALFCNGLWCGQSPTAIRAMIAAGYPPERILWYRGGMQVWRLLGLTVVTP